MFTSPTSARAVKALPVALIVVGQMVFGMATWARAQEPATQSDQQRQPATNRDANIEIDIGSRRNPQSNQRQLQLNAFVAATIAVKTESAAELSKFVAGQANGTEIGQFAQQAANQLQNQALRLRQSAALQTSGQSARGPADSQDPDLSQTAEEIGQNIQDRLEKRRDQSPVIESAEQPTGQIQENRHERVEQRALGRGDGQQRGRMNRGENRSRVVLPAIRENLPQIMELAGEALEKGLSADSQPRSHIELLVSIAEETLSAKQQELSRYRGEGFDQAFLGMMVDAGLEIESAASAAAPMADDSLQDTLQEVEQTAASVTEQARRLMTQDTDLARRQSADSQPTGRDGQGQP